MFTSNNFIKHIQTYATNSLIPIKVLFNLKKSISVINYFEINILLTQQIFNFIFTTQVLSFRLSSVKKHYHIITCSIAACV